MLDGLDRVINDETTFKRVFLPPSNGCFLASKLKLLAQIYDDFDSHEPILVDPLLVLVCNATTQTVVNIFKNDPPGRGFGPI